MAILPRHPLFLITLLLIICSLPEALWAKTLTSAEWGYRVEVPAKWRDNRKAVDDDRVRQLVSAGGNAVVEVYAVKRSDQGLQALANGFEQVADFPYMKTRLKSRQVKVGRVAGLLRAYEGELNGNQLESIVLYAYHRGVAFAVVGFGIKGSRDTLEMKTIVAKTAFNRMGPAPARKTGRRGQPFDTGNNSMRLGADSEQWSWLHLAGRDIWMLKPKGWKAKMSSNDGMLNLELGGKHGRAMVLVWGGNLGRQLSWRQLAELWERNSATLPNMAKDLGEARIKPVNSGYPRANLHFKEYAGRIDRDQVHTYAGYVTHEKNAYVVMGVFPEKDRESKSVVLRILRTFRLNRPSPVQVSAAAGVVTEGKKKTSPKVEKKKPAPKPAQPVGSSFTGATGKITGFGPHPLIKPPVVPVRKPGKQSGVPVVDTARKAAKADEAKAIKLPRKKPAGAAPMPIDKGNETVAAKFEDKKSKHVAASVQPVPNPNPEPEGSQLLARAKMVIPYDLDGDGKDEQILLVPFGTDDRGDYYSLIVIDGDSSLVWKGPTELTARSPLVPGKWRDGSSLPEAIGDIDGDGVPELIVAAVQRDGSPTIFHLLRWQNNRFKPVLTSTLPETPPGSGRFSWSGTEGGAGTWVSGFHSIDPHGIAVVSITNKGGTDASPYRALLQREVSGFSLIKRLGNE